MYQLEAQAVRASLACLEAELAQAACRERQEDLPSQGLEADPATGPAKQVQPRSQPRPPWELLAVQLQPLVDPEYCIAAAVLLAWRLTPSGACVHRQW